MRDSLLYCDLPKAALRGQAKPATAWSAKQALRDRQLCVNISFLCPGMRQKEKTAIVLAT